MDSLFTRVRDYLYDRLDAIYKEDVLHAAYGDNVPVPVVNIGGLMNVPFQVAIEELPVSDYSERATTDPTIWTQWEQRIHAVAAGPNLAEASRITGIYIDCIFQLCMAEKSLGRHVLNTTPAIISTEAALADNQCYAEGICTIHMKMEIPPNPIVIQAVKEYEREVQGYEGVHSIRPRSRHGGA